ncbi:hypothetical protein [Clostridium sp. KNHs214]|nr:hypothetical protein [Clostridium sp. KNHs214]
MDTKVTTAGKKLMDIRKKYNIRTSNKHSLAKLFLFIDNKKNLTS